MKALAATGRQPPVDMLFLFGVSEQVGVGASSVLSHDVAPMITIDDGTTAPEQASSECGVAIAMADATGPFDCHLTRRLIRLCG